MDSTLFAVWVNRVDLHSFVALKAITSLGKFKANLHVGNINELLLQCTEKGGNKEMKSGWFLI